jgi:hypothetical protein
MHMSVKAPLPSVTLFTTDVYTLTTDDNVGL